MALLKAISNYKNLGGIWELVLTVEPYTLINKVERIKLYIRISHQ